MKETIMLIGLSFYAVSFGYMMLKVVKLEMKMYEIKSLVDYLIEKDKLK